ncbi:amidohydrolase [Chryseobacterium sp. POL2]|uniref:amidohydrolase n=1 Tax=Chryseobacterium sp. POL2 TaxID=2713414 RepID=UPI0013E108F6|nr:amidohydrolase [Chryseobacterium sp. POL2]QIG90066.1 amidohydrolase [Chryseobacterium sp. POL2]
MSKLKIAGLNLDIFWKNKVRNYDVIADSFKNIEADVFLLPEMFSTGFCMDAEDIADRNNETLIWMQNFAQQKKTAIAGSVSICENEKFYNRFYFVKPDGNFDYYDKKHLFSYSGEDKIYTAGNVRKIIDYKGFRILLQVCYDLRFPVFQRNLGDYDLVINVANWPETRVEAWRTLLKARAVENQSFVFGLNRIGTDGNQLNYEESSLILFADGTEISARQNNIVTAELDLEDLKKFRARFPFLKDADEFELK